ncbi:TPA: hypothetical protein ENS27_06440 [bacterium]|nr:hypothetical protein [bacterium]
MELRAPSGVGKSYLTLTTAKLMPDEDVIFKTRITARYLDYLEENSLIGKILIIAERPGSQDANYSIRMITDDTSSGIVVGYPRKNPLTSEFESVDKVVKGPLVFVQTSTELDANPENESRVFNVYLNDSEEQRIAIQKAVKHSCIPHQNITEEERDNIIRRHKNAQRLLEQLPVAIPYAHLVEFPTSNYRSTRDLKRFLSFIKTSAFFHQYQRGRCEMNGKSYVVVNVVDYEIAYKLAKRVLWRHNQT